MTRRCAATFVILAASAAIGCTKTTSVNSLYSTDEKRIWIVRITNQQTAAVFRCADGAPPEQPPKPVCIRAPFVDSPE